MRNKVRTHADEGQITTGLVLVTTVLLLAFGAWFLIPLGSATDQRSQAQNAADAAALAGAQSIARDAPGQLVSALMSGKSLSCGLGQDAASDFAQRNDATVIDYCYFPVSDRIEVTARTNEVTQSGEREEFRAVSGIGLRLGPCSVPPPPVLPTPTPTPTPTPSPTPSGPTPTPTPPPPPDDVTVTGSCGDFEFDVIYPGAGGPPSFNINAAALKDLLEPRLRD